MGTVEAVLEDPASVRRQSGDPSDLEQPDLLVGQTPVGLQHVSLAPDHRQSSEIPPPGPDHGPGPGPVAGQLGHDHLTDGQHDHLGEHPHQGEGSVALEDGQQLVAPLELLQRDRLRRVPLPVRLDQRRLDGSEARGQLLPMTYPGIGRHDDTGSDDLGPPAQVAVLAHGHDRRVEPPELVEQVGAHQRGATRSHEHVTYRVVLAVVDLVGLDPLHHRTALVHGHPHVDQAFGVVPAEHLGRDHPGVGTERLFDQQGDGVGEQGHVVVAHQVVGSAVHHLADLVDRGPKAPVLFESADVGGGQHGRHTGCHVLRAACIEDKDRQLRIFLRSERGQRLFEPRTRIVGDDDGDDRRCQCVHQGPEAIGPEPR